MFLNDFLVCRYGGDILIFGGWLIFGFFVCLGEGD